MEGDARTRTICFVGDREDPWVSRLRASIADLALVEDVQAADFVPPSPFDREHPPDVLVLHRSRLTQNDVARLEGWLPEAGTSPPPRIILCYSPYVRYAELERAAATVDLAIPEATAIENLPRHVARFLEPGVPAVADARGVRRRVNVVSSDHALREVLVEACLVAGFEPRTTAELELTNPSRDESCSAVQAGAGGELTLWDVPLLETDWPERLERRCRNGPVLTLLGFPDRATVIEARARGASACLELPFDLGDLIHVLDQVSRHASPVAVPPRFEPAHAVPPPPAGAAIPRGRAAIRRRAGSPPSWPGDEPGPRIASGPAD
jgi:hypothetical protein